MTTAERQTRNDRIVEAVARGVSRPTIAATFGLDQRTIERIMADHRRQHPTLRSQDPLVIVDDMLEGYQADLSELANVSATAKNDAVRVGAINARMAARDRIVTLLQSTGVLPHDLGKLSVEIDVRYLATRVLTIFDKYSLPVEAREELLTVLESGGGAEQASLVN